MGGHILGIHQDGEHFVDHSLEALNLIRQGTKEAIAEINQIREEIMANNNRPLGLQPLLQFVRERFHRISRLYGSRARHDGHEVRRVKIRQISPSQCFRNPPEPCLFPHSLLYDSHALVSNCLFAFFVEIHDLDKRRLTDGH